jgi:heparanase 1
LQPRKQIEAHMKKGLILALVILLFLIVAIVVIGLWRSSGNIVDFINGQRRLQPTELQSDIPLTGSPDEAAYEVIVTVNQNDTIATLSDEYLSFAIDTSQVVGGKWWNPEAAAAEMGSGSTHVPVLDFNQPQLNLLASALAPTYLRIGGSEADKTFYDMDSDAPVAETIPPGYESVMTRPQWDAVNAFAQRNDLGLVFTLNAGPSARDANGRWLPQNAESLLAYSAEQGYDVDLWELGNELNIYWFVHGLDTMVSVEQYHEDLQTARALVTDYFPEAQFAGQGGAFWPLFGEPLNFFFGFTPAYLAQSGDLTDIVSWHYYPQQGRRGPIASRRANPSRLLDPSNLDEAGYWAAQMAAWRDEYAPGKPIWLGETGNAQFGGEPGLSDVYLGGLWWLDQLGLLATLGQDVVVRQTLIGSDYGMIDAETLAPRPDYWNSLLWKQLMGNEVYAVDLSGETADKLRAYAQTHPDGGTTLLLINLNHDRETAISLPQFANQPYELYSLTTPDIFSTNLLLNGEPLTLTPDGSLPTLNGEFISSNGTPQIQLNPLSYNFVVFPGGLQ